MVFGWAVPFARMSRPAIVAKAASAKQPMRPTLICDSESSLKCHIVLPTFTITDGCRGVSAQTKGTNAAAQRLSTAKSILSLYVLG